MAAPSTRSRVDPASRTTAKPAAAPRTKGPGGKKQGNVTKGQMGMTAGNSSKLGKSKLIASKLAFKGTVFKVFTETVVEPGGHKTTRDVIRHNGSVVILA